jgi:hypothetical protein
MAVCHDIFQLDERKQADGGSHDRPAANGTGIILLTLTA